MTKETNRDQDRATPPKEDEGARPTGKSDVHTLERVLRFVNAARVATDLTVLPHDLRVVDEAAAHMGDIPHHVEQRRSLDIKTATRILKARREADLLHGFVAIKDLIGIDQRILDIFLSAFGPATYGRWDYLYDMEAGGVELSIEHAALLRTGEVVFIESGTDTILWDPADEVTPTVYHHSRRPITGLTADLFCSGHVFLSDGKLLVVGGGGGGPGSRNLEPRLALRPGAANLDTHGRHDDAKVVPDGADAG